MQAGADLLAFETVPCTVELEAYLELLKQDELFREVQCWISVSLRDALHLNRSVLQGQFIETHPTLTLFLCAMFVYLRSGDSLVEAARLVEEVDPIGDGNHHQVLAFGINCTPPRCIEEAIRTLRTCCPNRLIVVYPNSGEVWEDKTWKPRSGVEDPEMFADMATEWVKVGAKLVGGCCRTNWNTIAAIRSKTILAKK